MGELVGAAPQKVGTMMTSSSGWRNRSSGGARRRVHGWAAAFPLALMIGLGTAAGASGTPIALLVPQGNAFGVLGHSCGGIQEAAYATGFDGTTGYPTGDVSLSTRCGGSGKGGGYHTTTYSAWVGVTWDFTGALVSLSVLSTAPAVDPAFSATDANGNQLYNQTTRAYLLLGPSYVPTPRVTSISTTVGPASGGTVVTITGTGFTAATGVSFGTAAAPFAVNDDTSITATSPTSTAGTVDVTVTSVGGTSVTVAGDQFTFVGGPVVTSVSPGSGTIDGGTTVTITGSNLAGASIVTFGETGAYFVVNDDTSLTAVSPAGEPLEAVDVTVTTVGGTSATTPAARFTYTPSVVALLPAVTGLAPDAGAPAGGAVVTITGTNFTGATAVDFGPVPATNFTVVGDTSITATAPAGAGPVDVTVTNADGPSSIGQSDLYTYLPPALTKLGPLRGRAQGGTRVTLRGQYLTGATEVTFDGMPGTILRVNTAGTKLRVVAPPEIGSGIRSVDVTVVTPSGATTLPAAFTYRP